MHGGRSSGPRTLAGKARSSQNAIKHGFYCGDFIALRRMEREELELMMQQIQEVLDVMESQ
jgi:hypothetical protein